MKILFNDSSRFRQRSGVGNYVEELWHQLSVHSNITPLTDTAFGRPLRLMMNKTLGGGTTTMPSFIRKTIKQRGHDLLSSYLSVSSRFQRYALYHEPDFIPLFFGDKTIATCHDLSVLKFPKWHPPHRVKHYEKRAHRVSSEIDYFIADSNQTRLDLVNMLQIPADRIDVVHLAPRRLLSLPNSHPSKLRLPEHYILYAGTIEPRKNIGGLLKAYKMLDRALKDQYPLIIVGGEGWNSKCVFEEIQRAAGVTYLGYLPDVDYVHCLRRASLFVFPSHFEGFGLPPLEAMAAGVPVVCSRAGSLDEIIGSAAKIIEPTDPEGIAHAITHTLKEVEVSASLIERGNTWVKQYTWEKTARLTLEAYDKAMW